MPQVTYKNTLLNVPDTIGGKPFLDVPDSERLDFFNLIEEKNPGIFSQGEAQSFVPEDEEDDMSVFNLGGDTPMDIEQEEETPEEPMEKPEAEEGPIKKGLMERGQ